MALVCSLALADTHPVQATLLDQATHLVLLRLAALRLVHLVQACSLMDHVCKAVDQRHMAVTPLQVAIQPATTCQSANSPYLNIEETAPSSAVFLCLVQTPINGGRGKALS